MLHQIDFLEEEKSEIDLLREEIAFLKGSNDKVRKSLFARHGELSKRYLELHDRMQVIEMNICKGKNNE